MSFLIEYYGPVDAYVGKPTDKQADEEMTDWFVTKHTTWDNREREIVWLKTHWRRKDGS